MIHVENLTKYYSQLCAVDQINLDIQKGEILGLLGPNGAGKTTTLRMLTGFLQPSSGNINIKGLSIDKHVLELFVVLPLLDGNASERCRDSRARGGESLHDGFALPVHCERA